MCDLEQTGGTVSHQSVTGLALPRVHLDSSKEAALGAVNRPCMCAGIGHGCLQPDHAQRRLLAQTVSQDIAINGNFRHMPAIPFWLHSASVGQGHHYLWLWTACPRSRPDMP